MHTLTLFLALVSIAITSAYAPAMLGAQIRTPQRSPAVLMRRGKKSAKAQEVKAVPETAADAFELIDVEQAVEDLSEIMETPDTLPAPEVMESFGFPESRAEETKATTIDKLTDAAASFIVMATGVVDSFKAFNEEHDVVGKANGAVESLKAFDAEHDVRGKIDALKTSATENEVGLKARAVLELGVEEMQKQASAAAAKKPPPQATTSKPRTKPFKLF